MKKERILAFILCFALLAGMMPATVFAVDAEPDSAETTPVVEEESETEESTTPTVEEAPEAEESAIETGEDGTETDGSTEESETLSGTCGDNLTWTLDDEGTLTISGAGSMTGYVWGTAPWDDSRASIQRVVMEDGVTTVGQAAFYGSNGLTSVTIPDSVTSIGDYAFYGCSSLTSITIPDSVTSIGYYAFYGCSSLTSITIPDSVTSIGNTAFSGCNLQSITVAEGNPNYSAEGAVLFNKNRTTLCGYFAGSNQTEYQIPDSVTTIGDFAFYGRSSLTSVTIPEGVMYISSSAFSGCSGLTSVTIPAGVTRIGSSAFSGCSSLTSITIPAGVTHIGSSAFSGCSSLTSVAIPVGVKYIESYAFRGCSSLADVYYAGTGEQWNEMTISDGNGCLKKASIHVTEVDNSVIASGACGGNLSWTLDSVGTLTISGTGSMKNYYDGASGAPWYSNVDAIKNVVMEEVCK